MTTILADARLGVMVADSHMSDGNRCWNVRKVQRIRGALVACAGQVSEGAHFLDWWRGGAESAPEFAFGGSSALVLDESGLYIFDESTIALTKVPGGREAIGSGSQGAMCAYEALCWSDPVQAVRIACKHDHGSRPPVRTYRLTTKGRPA